MLLEGTCLSKEIQLTWVPNRHFHGFMGAHNPHFSRGSWGNDLEIPSCQESRSGEIGGSYDRGGGGVPNSTLSRIGLTPLPGPSTRERMPWFNPPVSEPRNNTRLLRSLLKHLSDCSRSPEVEFFLRRKLLIFAILQVIKIIDS